MENDKRLAESLEALGRWGEARATYARLAGWTSDRQELTAYQLALKRCKEEMELASLFDKALADYQRGKLARARSTLVEVLERRPNYERNGRRAAGLVLVIDDRFSLLRFPSLSRRQLVAVVLGLMVLLLTLAFLLDGGFSLPAVPAGITGTPAISPVAGFAMAPSTATSPTGSELAPNPSASASPLRGKSPSILAGPRPVMAEIAGPAGDQPPPDMRQPALYPAPPDRSAPAVAARPGASPTATPTFPTRPLPVSAPIPAPVVTPLPQPTAVPRPTISWTPEPTATATQWPGGERPRSETGTPTAAPGSPTISVPATPTSLPPRSPSGTPTAYPTPNPTAFPTAVPTYAPTAVPGTPTEAPTAILTPWPTEAPTAEPTEAPTAMPTEAPAPVPTEVPPVIPTEAPTDVPTTAPTAIPSEAPPEPPTIALLPPTEIPLAGSPP